ncbi:hypothetical protein HAX54_016324, partial [Datura stramonium]|nr:hypothetical protein [Datura stramonium]
RGKPKDGMVVAWVCGAGDGFRRMRKEKEGGLGVRSGKAGEGGHGATFFGVHASSRRFSGHGSPVVFGPVRGKRTIG